MITAIAFWFFIETILKIAPPRTDVPTWIFWVIIIITVFQDCCIIELLWSLKK